MHWRNHQFYAAEACFREFCSTISRSVGGDRRSRFPDAANHLKLRPSVQVSWAAVFSSSLPWSSSRPTLSNKLHDEAPAMGLGGANDACITWLQNCSRVRWNAEQLDVDRRLHLGDARGGRSSSSPRTVVFPSVEAIFGRFFPSTTQFSASRSTERQTSLRHIGLAHLPMIGSFFLSSAMEHCSFLLLSTSRLSLKASVRLGITLKYSPVSSPFGIAFGVNCWGVSEPFLSQPCFSGQDMFPRRWSTLNAMFMHFLRRCGQPVFG